jgi:HK97 family phage prohead protease
VLNYLVVDDYGTQFAPGAFGESLQRRLPRLMYGHAGWENPSALLGRGIDYRDAKDGLDVLFEFDDFTYVPMARQIAYQMSNDPTHPTLDQFSIGFIRQRDTRDADGRPVITKGRLGETSVVVEGSVPGTKLLAFRNSTQGNLPFNEGLLLDANDAARIIARFSLGEIDLAQALTDVKHAVHVDMGTESAPAVSEQSQGDQASETTTPPVNALETPAVAQETDLEQVDTSESSESEPDTLPDTEADALLAEVDDIFDDVDALSYAAPIETRSTALFNGNQHSGTARTDRTDAMGGLVAARLPDTPDDDYERYSSRPAGYLVSVSNVGRIKTTRMKMWQDGKWVPHLAFEYVTGSGATTYSSVAAAKAAAGNAAWTDQK